MFMVRKIDGSHWIGRYAKFEKEHAASKSASTATKLRNRDVNIMVIMSHQDDGLSKLMCDRRCTYAKLVSHTDAT
jgi:hypothetical protein